MLSKINEDEFNDLIVFIVIVLIGVVFVVFFFRVQLLKVVVSICLYLLYDGYSRLREN